MTGALSPPVSMASLQGASFNSMPAPALANLAAMASTSMGLILTTRFSNGSRRAYNLAYQPFSQNLYGDPTKTEPYSLPVRPPKPPHVRRQVFTSHC